MIVSFLGPEGTFTQDAAEKLIQQNVAISDIPIEYCSCNTQQQVIQSVAQRTVDYGCVPIESTISGSVAPTLDGLINHPTVRIISECVLPIRFVLAARERLDLSAISSISVYPIAQQQVCQWMINSLPHAVVFPATNNAHAALDVNNNTVQAAITTSVAAQKNNLHVIESDIADNDEAKTRFILLAPGTTADNYPNNDSYSPALTDNNGGLLTKDQSSTSQSWVQQKDSITRNKSIIPPISGMDRTFLAFTLPNVPGSLSAAITELGMRGIDLIRLESRPLLANTSNLYWFFADFNGHINHPTVQEAVMGLKRRATTCYFFGSWPMAEPTGNPPPDFSQQRNWLAHIMGTDEIV